MASSSGSGAQQQQRRSRIVPLGNDDDIARFGEDARRPVYLVKIPVNVMETWRPLIELGGIEYIRNSGTRDLEPQVELGEMQLVNGEIDNGATIRIPTSDKGLLQFKLSLRPSENLKQRIISAEVGDRGQNVKFEGIVQKNGTLMPTSLDETYKAILKERVDKAEVKVQVQAIGQKEELEAMRKQGRVTIKGTGSSTSPDDAQGNTGHSSKRRKVVSEGKKKKTVKKKERDVSFDAVKTAILKCFSIVDTATGQKKAYWKRKDLRRTTGLQFHVLNPVLTLITQFHKTGPHANTYSLLPNAANVTGATAGSAGAAAGASTSSQ